MKTSTILVIVAAVLIIGGGTWWYLSQSASMPQMATSTNTGQGSDTTLAPGTTGSTTPGSPKTIAINYSSSSGFSPNSVTINEGDTVTFTSTDGSPMWVASDPHPEHTGYDGTSRSTHCAQGYAGPAPFDECTNSGTYSFTFGKTGSFGFHNHLAPQNTGTVVVQ